MVKFKYFISLPHVDSVSRQHSLHLQTFVPKDLIQLPSPVKTIAGQSGYCPKLQIPLMALKKSTRKIEG